MVHFSLYVIGGSFTFTAIESIPSATNNNVATLTELAGTWKNTMTDMELYEVTDTGELLYLATVTEKTTYTINNTTVIKKIEVTKSDYTATGGERDPHPSLINGYTMTSTATITGDPIIDGETITLNCELTLMNGQSLSDEALDSMPPDMLNPTYEFITFTDSKVIYYSYPDPYDPSFVTYTEFKKQP